MAVALTTVSPKAPRCPVQVVDQTLTVLTHGVRHCHRLADDDRVRCRSSRRPNRRHRGPSHSTKRTMMDNIHLATRDMDTSSEVDADSGRGVIRRVSRPARTAL